MKCEVEKCDNESYIHIDAEQVNESYEDIGRKMKVWICDSHFISLCKDEI